MHTHNVHNKQNEVVYPPELCKSNKIQQFSDWMSKTVKLEN